jgi:hypothetical protein
MLSLKGKGEVYLAATHLVVGVAKEIRGALNHCFDLKLNFERIRALICSYPIEIYIYK